MAQAVDSVQQAHPGLHIDVDDTDFNYLRALIRHAEQAELLVIGCPHSHDRWSIRVGVTAETLMRRATCPVMLVGQAGATDTASKVTANTASARSVDLVRDRP
jgi:nucleotide-binding universal stress UspA family protein